MIYIFLINYNLKFKLMNIYKSRILIYIDNQMKKKMNNYNQKMSNYNKTVKIF